MLFCAGSVVALAAWLSWSIAYALVAPVYGDEWYDVSLCAGLVGVPTTLLVVVFLPKVRNMFMIQLEVEVMSTN